MIRVKGLKQWSSVTMVQWYQFHYRRGGETVHIAHLIQIATTQPIFVEVVLLLGRKPPHLHHTTTPAPITISAVLDNLGSWFSVCNLILTQFDKTWKMTSIFLKMEEDLKFLKCKMTSNLKMGRRLQFKKNGGQSQFFKMGRQSHFV
jgi:hypothetical protein